MQTQFFSVREACTILRIGKTKLYDLLSNGELRSQRRGRKRLIERPSLESLIGFEISEPKK